MLISRCEADEQGAESNLTYLATAVNYTQI